MTGLLLDVVGWAGAAALLLAYGLVSAGRLDARSLRFQLLNLAGAVGLLSNGIWHGAWPSAALNAVWLVIGITAVGELRNSRTPRPSPARLGTRGTLSRAGDRPRTAVTAKLTRCRRVRHRPLGPTSCRSDCRQNDRDPALLRQVFALFPSGVAAVSANVDGEVVVLVASSFQVGISLEPPLVLLAVQHSSTSWPRLRDRPRLGVSVLGEAHDQATVRLASKTARDERLAGLETTTTLSGAHLIGGAAAWMECSVHSQFPAGDHDVVLLQVHALAGAPDTEPLVWHGAGFRTLTPPVSRPLSPNAARRPAPRGHPRTRVAAVRPRSPRPFPQPPHAVVSWWPSPLACWRCRLASSPDGPLPPR